jgi:hypothetical protein
VQRLNHPNPGAEFLELDPPKDFTTRLPSPVLLLHCDTPCRVFPLLNEGAGLTVVVCVDMALVIGEQRGEPP